MDKVIAVLLVLAGVFLLLVGFSALAGLILMAAWNFAIVSIAPETLPELSFVQAWGVSFLIAFVGSSFKAIIKKDD